MPEFSGSDDIPAIVVFTREGGLTDGDREWGAELSDMLAAVDGVGDASPAIESDDGEALQVFVPISGEVDETVAALRTTSKMPRRLGSRSGSPDRRDSRPIWSGVRRHRRPAAGASLSPRSS